MRKKTRACRVAGALIVTGVLAWAAYRVGLVPRFGAQAMPNVILIVLDTLRADRLGAYGSTTGRTPFLDRWAAHSVVYERAYAPSSWTVPSIASLFLARYPSEHQLSGWQAVLPPEDLTIAESLQQHGFQTAGFSANLQVSSKNGFDQGFEEFRLLLAPDFGKGDATQLNEAVSAWLEHADDRNRPFFLYLQYMEPHAAYRSHSEVSSEQQASDAELGKRLLSGALAASSGVAKPWSFDSSEVGRLRELYDGELAYLDARLAEIFAQLEKHGALRHALVVITADHGEDFGEHELFVHGTSLFEPSIHVPLIVRLPGRTEPERVPFPVELAGLAPAVLRELSVPIPPAFHVPALPRDPGTGSLDHRYAYSELMQTTPGALQLQRYAIVGATHKLLVTPNDQYLYYDLTSDPAEAHPLAAPAFAAELRQVLADYTRAMGTPMPRATAPLDATTRERLRSLGYTQ